MEQLLAPFAVMLPVIVLFIGFKLKSVETRIATIGVRSEHMLATMLQQAEALKGIHQAVENGNTLTRQLLRAYGQEPEA
jgi:hypothetical protein